MEHASIVLSQQRAAGEAPPHVPAHVCLLMHVGAEQANTRLQERERVSPAKLVRDGCDMMPAHPIYFVYLGGGCSTRIYVDSGRYRGLVSLCCEMRWPAGLLYAPSADEEAFGGPREGHFTAEESAF